jgi:hypothetical protein
MGSEHRTEEISNSAGDEEFDGSTELLEAGIRKWEGGNGKLIGR